MLTSKLQQTSSSNTDDVGTGNKRSLDSAMPPGKGLLDLPLELRHIVYANCLKATKPLIIYVTDGRIGLDTHISRGYPGERFAQYDIALNLIWCGNRTIASEAALEVYRLNTFEFQSKPSWQVLHDFLVKIGEANRRQLRSLVLHADLCGITHPFEEGGGAQRDEEEVLRTMCLGTLQSDEVVSPMYEKMDPRHFVAPTVGACFRLLGQTGPRLSLTIDVYRNLRFLVVPWSLHKRGNVQYIKAVEQVCRDHMGEQTGQLTRFDLLWRNTVSSSWTSRAAFESAGWEVVGWDEETALSESPFLLTKLSRRVTVRARAPHDTVQDNK